MADLDFTHHVSEIPRGDRLPESKGRTVKAEISSVPNFQGTIANYAQDTNWMSAAGSSLATRVSASIASKLGSELGKNPQGELGPTLTEFDKQLSQTYATQAHSTLGLQALTLINKSNLELAQAPRLDAKMIADTQRSNMQGLDKILSLAPDSVRPAMETQYGGVLIHQNEQLVSRMIDEQKTDQKQTLELSANTNAENAFALGLSGNEKAANAAINATNAASESASNTRLITPLQSKVYKDTVRQSFLSGREIRKALDAEKQGKLPEHLRSLADKPPSDINAADHDVVINNVVSYMQKQAMLRLQDQQLKVAQFQEEIIKDPLAASTQFAALSADLTPLQAENVKLKLMQAVKKNITETRTSDLLSTHWGDPTVFANSTAETINKSFNDKVAHIVEQSNKTTIPLRSPTPMSRDDAEVMVASSAAGQIPVFTRTMKNKLMSSNPLMVESGILQIHKLMVNGNGQALAGLSEQDWSMFDAAQNLRDSPDPIKANQDAHNRIYNQDPQIEKLNNQKFAKILAKSNSDGIPNDLFALKQFGFSKSDFLNPSLATVYGMNILGKLNNYFSISGNLEQAKISTQRWVDANYGNTFINGGKHTTLHPIEQVVGFSDRDGVPYIQTNIVEQLNQKLIPMKTAYDKGTINEYWETIPVKIPQKKNNFLSVHPFNEFPDATGNVKSIHPFGENLDDSGNAMTLHPFKNNRDYIPPSEKPSSEHGIFFKTYDPIKIKRHMKTSSGMKEDVFNVILIGNAFGDYDVAIETKEGMRNLYREAPGLGIMSVFPDKQAIMDHYMRDHK